MNPWRVLKMVVPGRVQYAIKNMLPQSMQDRLLFLWYAGTHDWRGCRAFSVPNNDAVGAQSMIHDSRSTTNEAPPLPNRKSKLRQKGKTKPRKVKPEWLRQTARRMQKSGRANE